MKKIVNKQVEIKIDFVAPIGGEKEFRLIQKIEAFKKSLHGSFVPDNNWINASLSVTERRFCTNCGQAKGRV